MKPEDFVPGPTIDTPQLLRDVLRCQDGVFVALATRADGPFDKQKFFSAPDATADRRDWPVCWRTWLESGRIRRALPKCPQTAAEMRAEAEARA